MNAQPLWLAFVLIACGGDKDVDSGSSLTTTGPTSTTPTVVDDSIQGIWNAKCTPCHIGGLAENLSLVDGHSALVGVPSRQVPSMSLVEPGSRDDSYLWRKLQNTYIEVGGPPGDPMPIGDDISPEKMEQIGTWIDDGAPEE